MLQKILIGLRINLLQILGIFFAGLLLLIQFLYSSDWGSNYPWYVKTVVIVSFIIYICIQVYSIYDNIDKASLKKEVNNWRKEASLLLESHIVGLAKKLNFGKDNNGYINRISIYLKSEKGFYCIGRYSDSEEFKKKSEKIYHDKGILGDIWDKGNRENKGLFDNTIPESNCNRKGYRKYHKEKYHLNDKDLDNLHMKSLLYYGWRIDENDSPKAIILFESTKRNKYTQDELDLIFHENIGSLKHIFKFILPNLPKPHYDNDKKL